MSIYRIIALFTDDIPSNIKTIDTSHNEKDFRKVFIVDFENASKRVFKVSCNGFTDPERIKGWQRCVEVYRSLGCYCPRIYGDRNGNFPIVDFEEHTCVVYEEEYSLYPSVDEFVGDPKDEPEKRDGMTDEEFEKLQNDVREYNRKYKEKVVHISENGYYTYLPDIYRVTAQIAGMGLDFTPFPSGYASFEQFDPNDDDEEIEEVAKNWHDLAGKLPAEYRERVNAIWNRWLKNREELKKDYDQLPKSVFQADMNPSNLLVDENYVFRGLMDFNLCGRDVLINYVFREAPHIVTTRDFSAEGLRDYPADSCKLALKLCAPYYRFGEREKALALPLFRYLKPLFYDSVEELEAAGPDAGKIEKALGNVEYLQTAEYDFAGCMA